MHLPPQQHTLVRCQLVQAGLSLADQTFVPDGQAVENIYTEDHLLESDDDGVAFVSFHNTGTACVEFDAGDLLAYAQTVSGDTILDLSTARTRPDITADLDPTTATAFKVACNLEDELDSLREEGGVEISKTHSLAHTEIQDIYIE